MTLRAAYTIALCGLVIVSNLLVPPATQACTLSTNYNGNVFRLAVNEGQMPVPFYIDRAAFGSRENLAAAAVCLWGSVPTSYLRLIEVSDGSQAMIELRVAETEDVWSKYDSNDEVTHGVFVFPRYRVETFDDNNLAQLVTHEIGHVIGLKHTLTRNSVMSYNRDSGYPKITDDDRLAVTRLYPADDTSYPVGCATTRHDQRDPPASGPTSGILSALLVLLAVRMAVGLAHSRRPHQAS